MPQEKRTKWNMRVEDVLHIVEEEIKDCENRLDLLKEASKILRLIKKW